MDEVIEQIRLEQACAGMVIAADVTDGEGRVLLPRGAVLRDTWLAMLRRHNVTLLTIVPQAPTDGADSRMAVLRERIERLFRKRGDSPLMRRLERAVLDYRAGKQP
ncbi:MAG: hypothetical protein HYU73_03780 [Betaproteobacteria bacterium]|nr:hypothetical protein [Betaproteobacteria bacterium]MBI3056955.1 hypothetical protein [Betaproteobacteria bacterium]